MNNTACKGCGEVVDLNARGYCATCDTVAVHWGFTRAQLSEAFDRVKSPENWKLPIDAMLEGRLSGPEKTVIDFSGKGRRAARVENDGGLKGRGYSTRVRAAGYYAAVGA